MFYLSGVFLSILGSKQAYLDPGSGSFLIQLLIAGLLGAALIIRGQWSKIKTLFARKKTGDETEDEDKEKDDA